MFLLIARTIGFNVVATFIGKVDSVGRVHVRSSFQIEEVDELITIFFSNLSLFPQFSDCDIAYWPGGDDSYASPSS